MSSRIGELKLHLRIAGELEKDAAEIRSAVERKVIVAVIEELERRLDAALGAGAIVRIRRVSLRWTLAHDDLADLATIARLAGELERDLLAEIAAQSPAERLRPRSSVIAVFASDAHAEAARLADLASGASDAWFHAGAADAAATWDAIVVRGASAVEEVVTWLARMECVEPVLALASDAALSRVAELAPARAAEVAVVQARRAVVAASRRAASIDRPATAGAAPSPVAPAVRPIDATATHTESAARPPDDGEGERVRRSVRTEPREDAPSSTPALARPTITITAATEAEGGPTPTRPAEVATPATASAEIATSPVDVEDGVVVHTEAAGLFYLVGRVLELDIAEALWAAGVVEGDALAHVARTFVDDVTDPAWRWFGGGFDRVPVAPSLPAWSIAETGDGVQHALGRRLAALGIERTPAQLAAELHRLATAIPRPAEADPATALVLERCAAALATIVAARLQAPPEWSLLRTVVARPGQLVVTPDAVRVVMAASLVDLDHRRAGLDQNPGHVPWLGRRLVIEFAGGESL